MAVGIRSKFSGGTQETYDATYEYMRLETQAPEGLIFHAAGPIDGGWGFLEFWETREDFDKYATMRLRTAIQELAEKGLDTTPDISEFPVHNIAKV